MDLQKRVSSVFFLSCALVTGVYAEGGNEQDSGEENIIIESSGDRGQEGEILVEDAVQPQSDVIVIEPETGSEEMIELETTEEETILQTDTPAVTQESGDETPGTQDTSTIDIGIDDVWLEHSFLTKNSEPVDNLNYGHIAFSATWKANPQWETRIAGRLDGYQQTGSPDWSDLDLDYGESYIRFRGETSRITLGTQKVIWGRIDEIPPTDRLSTQDLTRFILDDLSDRRRARPMIRAEYFRGDNKFDLVVLPVFREAELPDVDSIWYPIDRSRGKVLGMETTPAFAAIMATAKIVEDAPDSDGGVGLRFSRTEDNFDYALTLQRGRQTIPYFSYDLLSNTFTAIYPRSTTVAFDLGFESFGYTWRFEVAAQDEVTVTRANLSHAEAKGVNWAAGMEFFPGDGDSRVNLQLVGNHLIDAPRGIIEREDIYTLNGSVEIPFDKERWRANMRFFLGLDKQDVYLNPEIAFLGWEPHELYLAGHYFDGDDGTIGEFHEGHSLIAVGWRAKF